MKQRHFGLGLSILDRFDFTVNTELKTRYIGKWKYKIFHEVEAPLD